MKRGSKGEGEDSAASPSLSLISCSLGSLAPLRNQSLSLVLFPFPLCRNTKKSPFLSRTRSRLASRVDTPPSVAPVPPSQPLDEDSEDEDDSDVESPAASQSPEAREAERIRVLEAAGLLRRGSAATPKRKRRPPPPRPERRPRESSNLEQIIDTPLEVAEQHEGPPEDEDEQEERMEDAYDVRCSSLRG